jgi:hypothetical protein
MRSHTTTVFPLLESVVSIGATGVRADTATMNAAATLAFDSTGDSYWFSLGNSALGVSNAVLTPTSSGVYKANLAGGTTASLRIADPATTNLSWSTYGFWDVAMANGARTQSAFVTGYQTPAPAIPTTGTGVYYGKVSGEVILPQAGRENGVNYLALSGDASLYADFSTASLTGYLEGMQATDFEGVSLPWNSVSLMATISGGTFTGTSAATSAPGNSASLLGSANGTVAGMFFGPNADELGAVWTLSDGIGAAFGTIGAKHDKWGY